MTSPRATFSVRILREYGLFIKKQKQFGFRNSESLFSSRSNTFPNCRVNLERRSVWWRSLSSPVSDDGLPAGRHQWSSRWILFLRRHPAKEVPRHGFPGCHGQKPGLPDQILQVQKKWCFINKLDLPFQSFPCSKHFLISCGVFLQQLTSWCVVAWLQWTLYQDDDTWGSG